VTVFVDSSALYAVLDADDLRHGAAAETLRALVAEGEPLVTNNYVVVETTALAQRRLGRTGVRTLLQDLVAAFEVVWVDEGTHASCVAALLAAPGARISLVDYTCFDVMRQRHVERAFAFDRDFARAGFRVVPP
jgi:predicted nucleic acid-binding protein